MGSLNRPCAPTKQRTASFILSRCCLLGISISALFLSLISLEAEAGSVAADSLSAGNRGTLHRKSLLLTSYEFGYNQYCFILEFLF